MKRKQPPACGDPRLKRELDKRGLTWGTRNAELLERPRDYTHGSPFYKGHHGHKADGAITPLRIAQWVGCYVFKRTQK